MKKFRPRPLRIWETTKQVSMNKIDAENAMVDDLEAWSLEFLASAGLAMGLLLILKLGGSFQFPFESKLVEDAIEGISSRALVAVCGGLAVMGCLARVLFGICPPLGSFLGRWLDQFLSSVTQFGAACFGVSVGLLLLSWFNADHIVDAAIMLMISTWLLIVRALMKSLYSNGYEFSPMVQFALTLGSGIALITMFKWVLSG